MAGAPVKEYKLESHMYYGTLCKCNHDHEGGKSLRYISNTRCVECTKIEQVALRKKRKDIGKKQPANHPWRKARKVNKGE